MRKIDIKKAQKQAQIFGVGISSTSLSRVLRFVRDFLSSDRKKEPFFIITPYSEMLLKAKDSLEYREVLNSADLKLPDGISVIQAIKFLRLKAPQNKVLRIPIALFQGLFVGFATFFMRDWLLKDLKPIKGRVAFLEMVKLANKKGWKVFLFGGEKGEAALAAQNLGKSLKSLKIKAMDGPFLDKKGRPVTKEDEMKEKRAIASINAFSPQILFLAFTPPKQEYWFDRNRKKLKIGGAVAVGGTFNYIAGRAKLPPAFVESLSLEWLWRLITEPTRVGRIFRAFPVFPLSVFWEKIRG